LVNKRILVTIERGETIKDTNECGVRSFGLWSWLEVRSVQNCERGGNGKWLNGEKKVWRLLEEESRESKPRRRGADLRIPDGRFAENRSQGAE
jgi:hypothetical protein